MGSVTIDSQEYRGLILQQRELEDANTEISKMTLENKKLEEAYEKKQEELKELILTIVGNETSFYKKIETYDIKEDSLAKYLNKYYYNKGKLEFEKLETEIKATGQAS